jgi:hypothetical protein
MALAKCNLTIMDSQNTNEKFKRLMWILWGENI